LARSVILSLQEKKRANNTKKGGGGSNYLKEGGMGGGGINGTGEKESLPKKRRGGVL